MIDEEKRSYTMWLWLLANQVFTPDEQGDLIASASTDAMPASASPDLGIAFFKMLMTFAALILLLLGTYWIIRRLIQQRLQKGVGQQAIQILEKKMLSPKTILYLVEVENKKVLIAESHLEIKRIESFDLASEK